MIEQQIDRLAANLANGLQQQGLSLAVAESCSGGWLAKVLTDVSGCSAWFLGGVVSYSNAAKQRLLSVGQDCLQEFGAVSEPVARQMVVGVCAAFSSNLGVSITGVAGPAGGTADKPVGMVCFAVQNSRGEVLAITQRFAGDREQVRLQAVAFALSLLLEAVAD
ncbi:MAG: nicotinamide-nucleotide amidohydrolase family protein [Cycloclasticus sp.]